MHVPVIPLKPLKRITPSRYTAITKCPYRVVLANSVSTPFLPYPPNSHLGNVVHECIRLILVQSIRTVEEFDEQWEKLIEKEEISLNQMGFSFFTPLSKNIRGYTVKKLQVRALLDRNNRGASTEKLNSKVKILTEKWLESRDSLIGGYADIIFNREGFSKLSDFKTGKILANEGQIKDEYEDQLKLYAYLYNEEFAKYPDELSIIDLEKKEYSISFSVRECDEIAVKSKRFLSDINSLIVEGKRDVLAKPDRENCGSCLYRPACKYYWNISETVSETVFLDLKGRLLEVRKFKNGNVNATIVNRKGEAIVSHINSSYYPLLSEAIGKEIAFYNIRRVGEGEIFQTLKTTKIYEY